MVTRLEAQGEEVSFAQFMDLALHDPEHGAYGSGALKVGPDGDFVTSPSLGPDFAGLLVDQLIQWLDQIAAEHPGECLSLVEMGPGEGHLAVDLLRELERRVPEWMARLELVLVELNPGMEQRQRQCLAGKANVPVRWVSLETLQVNPVHGVVLAHEVLDAFPVERLLLRDGDLRQMTVTLEACPDQTHRLQWSDCPLPESLQQQLHWARERCGLRLPPDQAEDGWTTEWHTAVGPWMQAVAEALTNGVLLVIDYAHEASRYYNARRPAGTLMAYRQQVASGDLLGSAGLSDLTAHLCLETLIAQAEQSGWQLLGHCRQGEALLALGLSDRLHSLQQLPPDRLAEALGRREALLRLVDPAGLGDFRWIALDRVQDGCPLGVKRPSRCLDAPEAFS